MTKKYIQNCTGDKCEALNSATSGWSRLIFYVLLAGFFSVAVYVLLFSPYLQISNINISGNQELNRGELQQKFEDSLQGRIWGVIPRNNFLLVSKKRTELLLAENFKKIRSVQMVKKFPNSISIIVDERKALLVWCGGDGCFLLDEGGVAYGQADFNSPELVQNHLLQITEKGGQVITIGEKIIEFSYEQYALAIKAELGKLGVEVSQEYWTPSRMAEEINVRTAQGNEFYFSTQFPLDSALRNLAVIFQKEIPEDKRSEIVYVDLRNESKIFYKLKNAESTELENENIEKTEK